MALKRSPGGSAIYDARRRRATALSGEQLAVPGAEPLSRQGWNTDQWETPWEVVRTLEEEFGPFDLDPCATVENHKAAFWFGEDINGTFIDGLNSAWWGRAFCNPPYSSIDVWIRKAVAEQARGVLVVMLLPVRTDRDWWHDLVQPNAEVRFLRGRQRFIGPDGTTTGRPVFASAIAVFRPGDHRA